MFSSGCFTFDLFDNYPIYDPNSLKLGMAVNKGLITELITVLFQCTST